jgi:hypothetical protein
MNNPPLPILGRGLNFDRDFIRALFNEHLLSHITDEFRHTLVFAELQIDHHYSPARRMRNRKSKSSRLGHLRRKIPATEETVCLLLRQRFPPFEARQMFFSAPFLTFLKLPLNTQ